MGLHDLLPPQSINKTRDGKKRVTQRRINVWFLLYCPEKTASFAKTKRTRLSYQEPWQINGELLHPTTMGPKATNWKFQQANHAYISYKWMQNNELPLHFSVKSSLERIKGLKCKKRPHTLSPVSFSKHQSPGSFSYAAWLPTCERPMWDNLDDWVRGVSSSTFISEDKPPPLLGTKISEDFFSNFQSCIGQHRKHKC